MSPGRRAPVRHIEADPRWLEHQRSDEAKDDDGTTGEATLPHSVFICAVWHETERVRDPGGARGCDGEERSGDGERDADDHTRSLRRTVSNLSQSEVTPASGPRVHRTIAVVARFTRASERTGYPLPAAGSRLDEQDVQELLDLCESDDVVTRQIAAKNLCTCHVLADDERIWSRLLLLMEDPDARVRRDALHALTDSTPAARVPSIVPVLEAQRNDPDLRLRRRVRKTLAYYRRTGKLTDAPR
jgi:hypothetical protein